MAEEEESKDSLNDLISDDGTSNDVNEEEEMEGNDEGSDDEIQVVSLTPSERKKIRKAKKMRIMNSFSMGTTSRVMLMMGSALCVFGILFGVGAEAMRKKNGKAPGIACLFCVSQLLWAGFGNFLVAITCRGCCCTSCTPYGSPGSRSALLSFAWLAMLITISLNLATVVMERSSVRETPRGAHAVTALLWIVTYASFCASYFITKKVCAVNDTQKETLKNLEEAKEEKKRAEAERQKQESLAALEAARNASMFSGFTSMIGMDEENPQAITSGTDASLGGTASGLDRRKNATPPS